MSKAEFNRVGQDSTEVEMITFGNAKGEVHLRNALLDGQKDYVFGITSLSVPLQDCPMHPVTESTPLFKIHRRNVGKQVDYTVQLGEVLCIQHTSDFGLLSVLMR